MEFTYAQICSQGPVRSNNEDYVGCWQPKEVEEQRNRGAVVAIADGVGGQGEGEVASRLAVETAIARFQELKPDTPPRQALFHIFTYANLAVYDHGMENRDEGRMATTLTISLLRNDEVTIGHVGDCRVYLVEEGRIRRITADHSYAAMQVKMGLMSEEEAAASDMRCVLTRSIGKEPTVQVDYYTAQVRQGNRLVQCSDGLHHCVRDEEIAEIVNHHPPAEACRQLVDLAVRRGTDDNLSVQIVEVDKVEHVMYYRGLPIYCEPEPQMSPEMEVGQVLDERFQITERHQPQRHGHHLQGPRPEDRAGRGGEGAVHAVRERPGLLLPLRARGEDRPDAGSSLHPPHHRRGGEEPALHRDGAAPGADAAAGAAERRAAAGRSTPWTLPRGSARPWSTCTPRTSSIAT